MEKSTCLTRDTYLIICLFFGGVSIVSFMSSNSFKSLLTSQALECPLLRTNNISVHNVQLKRDALGKALEKASTINKTVIVTVINKAYVEGLPSMLDILLEGFWLGEGTRELVKHMVVVAVDQTAYDRCLFRGLHCYKLVTEGVDFNGGGEVVYMSEAFTKMMWRRTLLLHDILKKGYSFIFTDADIIWLRNPFIQLSRNDTNNPDIQFSIDHSTRKTSINTGFYSVKSNNKTISMFKKWHTLKDNSSFSFGLKEQDVLQKMNDQGMLSELNIKVRYLNTRYFSGFCQESRDIQLVITVHANCCRYIKAKVEDLNRVLRDWVGFRYGLSNVTTFKWSPHLGCYASWRY